MSRIRVVALAVLADPATGALFVDESTDPSTGRSFHRPPGGEVEFGESAAEAIARELDEEYGLAVSVGRRLGALENRFVLDGKPGHEIVLVHEVELDGTAAPRDGTPCRDQDGVVGVWRPRQEAEVPLYPAGISGLLEGTVAE
ncbi:NUDIX domain-containing protein [Luteimicrobium sp. DT211]|uniref:NUDIX domain-containing protein n=1 Tax=Luteimicrobium sp. DT211 TaxID=3393412 RepID=UPI003CF4466B